MAETVLVLGSNGLVGYKLVEILADRAAVNLVAVSRGDNRNPNRHGYTYESTDLTDLAQVSELFARYRPTAVVNAAGLTLPDTCERDPAACHAANVQAVGHLVDAAQAYDAHLIHLSTDFVFDGAAGPYRESDVPAPLSEYGRAKLRSEEIVLAAAANGLRAAVVRTVLVYGLVPNASRGNFVLWVRERLLAGEPIRVVNDQWRTPTLADDLAEGIVTVWARRKTGLFHLSGAELMSVHELAMRVARFWKLDESLITAVETAELQELAPRPKRSGFLLLKAQTELDYRPRSLEDGLQVLDRQMNAFKKN